MKRLRNLIRWDRSRVLLLILLPGLAGGQETLPGAYPRLQPDGGEHRSFVIQYGGGLHAVTCNPSCGPVTEPPDHLLFPASGRKIALSSTEINRQTCVLSQLVPKVEAPVPWLRYEAKFTLKPGETLLVYTSAGAEVEARVELLTLGLECTNLEGPVEIRAVLPAPADFEKSIGSPVIRKATGAVVGVLLGGVPDSAGRQAAVETLCLPDLGPKAVEWTPPVYKDPEQAAAYGSFARFAGKIPMVHWETSDAYFKAFGQDGAPDSAEEFVEKNKITELEVKAIEGGVWQGALKLWDEKIPSEYWRYQFVLKGGIWKVSGGQKLLGNSTIDLFAGDGLFQRCFARAMRRVVGTQKPGPDGEK